MARQIPGFRVLHEILGCPPLNKTGKDEFPGKD